MVHHMFEKYFRNLSFPRPRWEDSSLPIPKNEEACRPQEQFGQGAQRLGRKV